MQTKQAPLYETERERQKRLNKHLGLSCFAMLALVSLLTLTGIDRVWSGAVQNHIHAKVWAE